jgi:hypothetical protein
MSTLTDRYVAATLRGVPEKQRDDVEGELRASVADAVDGLVGKGLDPSLAERQVLTDLGDPDRLAADYSDRPLYLIGPALFLDYVRLLKVLLAVVAPIAMVAVGLGQYLAGNDVGGIFAGAISTGLSVIVNIAFWTTLVFVLIERSGPDARRSFGKWSLDRLPEMPARRKGLADMIGSVTWIAVLIALIFAQQFAGGTRTAGGPVLNPDLWSFWLPVLVVLLVAEIILEIVRYRLGGWTIPLAVANLGLNAAVAVLVIWLLRSGQLLNDAFFEAVGWPEGGGANGAIAVLGTVGMLIVAAISVIDGFVRAIRRR